LNYLGFPKLLDVQEAPIGTNQNEIKENFKKITPPQKNFFKIPLRE